MKALADIDAALASAVFIVTLWFFLTVATFIVLGWTLGRVVVAVFMLPAKLIGGVRR